MSGIFPDSGLGVFLLEYGQTTRVTVVTKPADYLHLLQHAWDLFPGAMIDVEYGEDETIHVLVDGHRFTFEIGSDDDCYAFSDGETSFVIPLMENPEDFWDFS